MRRRMNHGPTTASAPPRIDHPIFARMWPHLSRQLDRAGAEAHRQRLVAHLSGAVVEIGVGDGRNFAHYPPHITRLLAVEPEPRLRALAAQQAQRAPFPIEVVDGTAEALPADADQFDAAVSSLVLCTVADPGRAARELARVLTTGGQLRFFEHVASDTTRLRRVQRLLDATLWPCLGGGCHTARDTVATLRDSGFVIEDLDRFPFPGTALPLPTSPHVLGRARRP
jgi:ubiquinone/menaquinone biosynthesis C-methylase UbiE